MVRPSVAGAFETYVYEITVINTRSKVGAFVSIKRSTTSFVMLSENFIKISRYKSRTIITVSNELKVVPTINMLGVVSARMNSREPISILLRNYLYHGMEFVRGLTFPSDSDNVGMPEKHNSTRAAMCWVFPVAIKTIFTDHTVMVTQFGL